MKPRFAIALHASVTLGFLMLGACASTAPTHYHTLLGAGAETAVSPTPASFLIDVQAVGIPAQVDRPQLVVRDSDGMIPLEHERWIAPLADEARTALSADLSRELAATDVAGQPRPEGAKVVTVKVDLRRFDSVADAYAAIAAVWSLSTNEAHAQALVCGSEARETVGAGYEELVQGHRRALGAIASRIASAARAYAAAGKGACPLN